MESGARRRGTTESSRIGSQFQIQSRNADAASTVASEADRGYQARCMTGRQARVYSAGLQPATVFQRAGTVVTHPTATLKKIS